MIEVGQYLPFDIQDNRTLFIESFWADELAQKIPDLVGFANAAIASPADDNPVAILKRERDLMETGQDRDAQIGMLLKQVEDLSARVQRYERSQSPYGFPVTSPIYGVTDPSREIPSFNRIVTPFGHLTIPGLDKPFAEFTTEETRGAVLRRHLTDGQRVVMAALFINEAQTAPAAMVWCSRTRLRVAPIPR